MSGPVSPVFRTAATSADSIANSHLANMAEATIKGRPAGAGLGDPVDLTAAQTRAIINVEDGATADQTAAEILALLLTVDGAASGLDADFLDGLSSTDFSIVGHTHPLVAVSDVTITAANLNSLDDGVDSTLHFHDSDRNRANHTGTQVSATISDFAEAVDDRTAVLIQNGTGITWTYDDVANTLTPTVTITQYTDELAQDAVGTILVDSATIDFTYTDATPAIGASVIPNSHVQKVEVAKNSGAVVGTRKQLNLIEGTQIALTIADDGTNDQVDITVSTSGLGTAATKNTGTSGDTVPLCNSNPTIGDRTLTVGANLTTNNSLRINGAAGFDRSVYFMASGVKRWYFGADTSTESGSDAGSNLLIINYSDAGSLLGTPFRLQRATGALQIGAPTGGFKGAGTINAQAVYDDNVLLTCYAIEAYKQGSVDIAYWDAKVLDLDIPAQPEQVETRQVTRKVQRVQREREGLKLVERLIEVDEPVYDTLPIVNAAGQAITDKAGQPLVELVPRTEKIVITPAQPARIEARTHGPAARFALRATELLDPKLYGAAWKATGHLPAMPSPAEWEASGKKLALGDIQQRLWETVEVQAIHIDKLLARIEALEAKLP